MSDPPGAGVTAAVVTSAAGPPAAGGEASGAATEVATEVATDAAEAADTAMGSEPAAAAEPDAAPAPVSPRALAAQAAQAPKASGAIAVAPKDSAAHAASKASGALPASGPRSWLRRGREGALALREGRGLAWAWAGVLVFAVLTYVLDLGSGSLWNGPDALFALAARGLAREGLQLGDAARTLPAPTGAPLSLWGLGLLVRLLGSGDFVLRLLPALAALACAFCLLTVAIDVGVGRHAGGLGGLLFLALPLTYELSHRVLPDMLIAASATFAVALCSHALHGHHFDRHILPSHAEDDAPAPLPLRRTPMALAAGAIGVAAMVSRRAALIALLFAVLDVLLVNRYLLRKRRVWLALASGVALILLAARVHGPGALGGLWQLGVAALRTLGRPQLWAEARAVGALLWTQGASLYDAAAGGVPLAGGANALVTGYAPLAGRVLIVAAGFGVLFSLIRRPSRPLALWLLSSGILSIVGAGGEPRRALVLLLPPLALCAAVGIETPVRWLGRLGNLTTMAAVAGILAAWVNGQAVLHRDDTVRALAQSQRRAPAGALLCTVGLPAAAARHYTGRPVSEFRSAAELAAALGREQPLSCLIPAELHDAVAQALLGQRDFERAQAARGRTRGRREPGAALGSVLATVLDFEEPPPDAPGPKVLLVNR